MARAAIKVKRYALAGIWRLKSIRLSRSMYRAAIAAPISLARSLPVLVLVNFLMIVQVNRPSAPSASNVPAAPVSEKSSR